MNCETAEDITSARTLWLTKQMYLLALDQVTPAMRLDAVILLATLSSHFCNRGLTLCHMSES